MRIRYINENTSITDDDVLSLCLDNTGRISSNVYRKLREDPSYKPIKDYLDTRYDDIPDDMFSYKEVLFRIKNHIEERPTCKICGEPVTFVGKTCGGKFPNCYHATCCKEHERLLAKRNETETLKSKYGVDTTFKIPEINQRRLERSLTPEAKAKRRQTMKDRYGYEYAFRNPESVKVAMRNSALYRTNRAKNTLQMNKILLENPGTTIDDYRGIPEYEELVKSYDETTAILNKTYNTQKENGTMSTSSKEERLYDILSASFDDVDRNHKEERYKHKCDFYIPDLDLFIEYQGSMFHGQRPYDPEDEICKEYLEYLLDKSELRRNATGKEVSRYDSVIAVWTYGDVIKREEALANGLNYLEIYPNIDLEEIPEVILNNYDSTTKGKHLVVGVINI